MRYFPTTLSEARNMAVTLEYESQYGGASAERCLSCGESTFVNEETTVSEIYDGYCMNPKCRCEVKRGEQRNIEVR